MDQIYQYNESILAFLYVFLRQSLWESSWYSQMHVLLLQKRMSTTFSHLIVAAVFVLNPGDTCVGAKPTPEIYSTKNILLSSESVFIVEFTLKCDNNAKV